MNRQRQGAAVQVGQRIDVDRPTGRVEQVHTVEHGVVEEVSGLRNETVKVVGQDVALRGGDAFVRQFGQLRADVLQQVRDAGYTGDRNLADTLGVVQTLRDGTERPQFTPDTLGDSEVRSVVERTGNLEAGRDPVLDGVQVPVHGVEGTKGDKHARVGID